MRPIAIAAVLLAACGGAAPIEVADAGDAGEVELPSCPDIAPLIVRNGQPCNDYVRACDEARANVLTCEPEFLDDGGVRYIWFPVSPCKSNQRCGVAMQRDGGLDVSCRAVVP